MGRIYRSAKKLARRSGMDEDELDRKVKDGAIKGRLAHEDTRRRSRY